MPHTIDIFMICWEGICICWDKFETHYAWYVDFVPFRDNMPEDLKRR